ncbi:MAG: citramalate synthase [Proteobacteria bacterium]|nr:citramalate synthase [Pseudomonadota bacterium]
MSEQVRIYDCTLRDGAQAEGISFSVDDKLQIARRLDELGIHYIEGGWPNPTNPKDLEFFVRARDLPWRHARIAAFGSTRRANNAAEDDSMLRALVATGTPVVTIFGKSWLLHVREALRITPEQNLALIGDSVAYLKSQGREVVYDAEHFFDGYAADPAYALETVLAAQEGGADVVVFCDTNGGTLPGAVRAAIEAAKARLRVPFGIHTHNDGGLAAANSLVAVELGAGQVQGTINGLGERCGNANLCTVVPMLELKLGRRTIGAEGLARMTDLARFASEVANVYHDHRQPYVGQSAFAHKGGVHIDAMLKQPLCYEHCLPELVGNQRRYLLSEQSGGATVAAKIEHLLPGMDKRHPTVQDLLHRIKHLEHEGYVLEGAEASVEILVRKALGTYREPFRLIGCRTINRQTPAGSEVEAIVKLEVNGRVYHTVADGDGPVNALDQALRRALEEVYPQLAEVTLRDYKVRVLSSGDGTAARVRVLIESSDGEHVWSTIGVSENIIEASWIALLDSLSYKLLRDGLLDAVPQGPAEGETGEQPAVDADR